MLYVCGWFEPLSEISIAEPLENIKEACSDFY
jgi:hypothetical protein